MFTLPPKMPFAWNRSDALLNVGATLSSGQSFRWRQDAQGIWWGVVGETVFALWQSREQGTGNREQDKANLIPERTRKGHENNSTQEKELPAPYSPLPAPSVFWQSFPEANRLDIFGDYFRLDVPLEALYSEWERYEPEIGEAVRAFRGMRLLRQPVQECFFGFQCATCNTVVKIERSVRALAVRYGEAIPLPFDAPFVFHRFPTLEALANAEETVLRADLWGYRAPRVIALARHLLTKEPAWLESLRQVSYAEAHAELTALHGIGAKIADCICLFCLDKDAATPVDTHIRQIAVRLFSPQLSGKSLTPKVYTEIAATYSSRFGAFAGWAQQYLFFGELGR